MLANLTGLKQHNVVYALQSLTDRGIIQPVGVIDPTPLGYQAFDVNFSVDLPDSAERQRFVTAVKGSDRVSGFFELAGEFEYSMKIWVKNIGEITQFFDKLGRRFGDIFLSRSISVEHSYYGYGRRFFDKKPVQPLIERQPPDRKVEIDAIDHKILSRVAAIPLLPVSALGRELGLAASTVEYRIKRLERDRIILGYVYRLHLAPFGFHRVRVLLFSGSYAAAFHSAVLDFAKSNSSVFNLSHTIGVWDYELGIEVAGNEDLRNFIRQLQSALGGRLRKLLVLPIFEYHKLNGYPFRQAED